MTDEHAMLIPLMAASIIAYGLSRLVCSDPLYHALGARYLAPIVRADNEPLLGESSVSETPADPGV